MRRGGPHSPKTKNNLISNKDVCAKLIAKLPSLYLAGGVDKGICIFIR